jgi:hypothetical protein
MSFVGGGGYEKRNSKKTKKYKKKNERGLKGSIFTKATKNKGKKGA